MSDYTTGNISDIDHNVNHEAEGPFECIYVKTLDGFVLL